MTDADVSIRAATRGDARDLARLIDIAGEGIPGWLWARAAAEGEDALDVGVRRAARSEGSFSYRNAHVLVADGRIAGMLIGSPLPAPYPDIELAEVPAIVRPMIELEALAPGSWYVNAIAVYDQSRGRGYGKRLLELGETLAAGGGCPELSLIVAENNATARALYERVGFRVRARRPHVPEAGLPGHGDWLLMAKPALGGIGPGG